MPPKLVTILVNERLALPGMPLGTTTVPLAKIHQRQWRVHVRGPKVYFESPDGLYYETARSALHLGWEGQTEANLGKDDQSWSSPPRDELKKAATAEQLAKEMAAPKPVTDDDPNDPDAPLPVKQGKR